MPKTQSDAFVLSAALQGLEFQRQQIDNHIAQVRSMLGGSTISSSPASSDRQPRTRKKFSAATRRKMALAQRRRYAAMRGEAVAERSETAKLTTKIEKRKKRKLSPEAIERIRAGVKRRWAAQRKQVAASARKATGKRMAPAEKSAPSAKAAAQKTGRRTARKAATRKTAMKSAEAESLAMAAE